MKSNAAENIELRSEKVRNIIGQIPSRIVTTGISTIFFILALLITGAWVFKYDYMIKASAEITPQTDSTVFIQIRIPSNQIKRISKGQPVVLSFDNINGMYGYSLFVNLPEISKTIYISRDGSYYLSTLSKPNPIITLNKRKFEIKMQIFVEAAINTGKIRFLNRILRI